MNKSSKKAKFLFHAVSVLENELGKETFCDFKQSYACTIGGSLDKVVA